MTKSENEVFALYVTGDRATTLNYVQACVQLANEYGVKVSMYDTEIHDPVQKTRTNLSPEKALASETD